MKIASILLAGTLVLSVDGAARAGDSQTGLVTQLNRLTNTISIKRVQTGTVGANTAGASENFRVKDGLSTDDLHAGDRISFESTDKNGVMTLTGFKIESTAAR
jgi:peptidoglycan hydrolase-like protein with peptidoglycan-binding domain